MSSQDLERFKELLLEPGSEDLCERLANTPDKESFVSTAVAEAEQRGFSFTPEEVWAAMEAEKEERKRRSPDSVEEINAQFDTFRGRQIIDYLKEVSVRY